MVDDVREIVTALVPVESRRGVHSVFSAAVGPNRTTAWEIICYVADVVTAEVAADPGRTFAMSKKESEKSLYPLMRTLVEAAEDFRDFRSLFALYGQVAGALRSDGPLPANHDLYAILHHGEAAINTLVKAILVTEAFYKAHPDTAFEQPIGPIVDALSFLWKYFRPNALLFSEIFPTEVEPVGLSSIKDEIYKVKTAIMDLDLGAVHHRYRNDNGLLVFFHNHAVQITIDSAKPGAREMHGENERLWQPLGHRLDELGVMNNAGSMHTGRLNTYTIPAGADWDLVLDGLCNAGFITGLEKRTLRAELDLAAIAPEQAPRKLVTGPEESVDAGLGG